MILGGVEVNDKKPLVFALSASYGINYHKALQLLSSIGLSSTYPLRKLNKKKILQLEKGLTCYTQNFQLKRNLKSYLKVLRDNKSYRGIRHTYCLSVRGQRTHTNCGTQKSKRPKKNVKKK